jgi:hypothetical protein
MPRRASKKVLTEAQRSAIAEARSIYESRVGERRIMYQSAVAGVSSTFRSRREGAAKMSKSTDLLKLSTSAKTAAARLAKAEGVSLDLFIASAVAEKVGVIETARQFFGTARRPCEAKGLARGAAEREALGRILTSWQGSVLLRDIADVKRLRFVDRRFGGARQSKTIVLHPKRCSRLPTFPKNLQFAGLFADVTAAGYLGAESDRWPRSRRVCERRADGRARHSTRR